MFNQISAGRDMVAWMVSVKVTVKGLELVESLTEHVDLDGVFPRLTRGVYLYLVGVGGVIQ